MNTIGAKLLDVFKHLKSDAVPKPPRETKSKEHTVTIEDVTEDNVVIDENIDTSNDHYSINSEADDVMKNKKSKAKKKSLEKPSELGGNNDVHTQATGNVWNIVGSSNVHVGNVYNLPPTQSKDKAQKNEDDIKKSSLITTVMGAKIKAEHQYIDHIAKNLGLNWQSFFRRLGFSQGRIETFQIDCAGYGVSEVRYKLLLDWACNDDDGTLGYLATQLWEEGERQVVKDLANMYKSNIKK